MTIRNVDGLFLAVGFADPDHEQFAELVEAIQSENYEYVVVWGISRLARLGSIYQRFFEHCEDAGTTVAITEGWLRRFAPMGQELIVDISGGSGGSRKASAATTTVTSS